MNVSDIQPIRIPYKQVADNINLNNFYQQLAKSALMQQTQYLSELCNDIDILRQMCRNINCQTKETYIGLYTNCLELLKAFPWNNKTVRDLLQQGFQYKDSYTGQKFASSPNLSYDIIVSLYNIIATLIYECQKRTETEEGFQWKANKFLEAIYYCQLAQQFIKENQEYVKYTNDVSVGHSIFTGYQNLFLAYYLECFANIIIIRSQGHPETQAAFIDKLKQYWSYCNQLYQQAKQQLNQLIQLDRDHQILKQIEQRQQNIKIGYIYLHILLNKDNNKPQVLKDEQYINDLYQQQYTNNLHMLYAQIFSVAKITEQMKYDSEIKPVGRETQFLNNCQIDYQAKVDQLNINLPVQIEPKEVFIPQHVVSILNMIKCNYQRLLEESKRQAQDTLQQQQQKIDQTVYDAQEILQAECGGKIKELQMQLAQQDVLQQMKDCKQLKQNLQQFIQQIDAQIKKLKDLEIQDTKNKNQFGIYWNSQQARQQIQQSTVQGIQFQEELKQTLQSQQFDQFDQYNEIDYKDALNYKSEITQSLQHQQQLQNIQKIVDKVTDLIQQITLFDTNKELLWIYEKCSDQQLSFKNTEQVSQNLIKEDKINFENILSDINKNISELQDKCKQYQKTDRQQKDQFEQKLQKLQSLLEDKQMFTTYLKSKQNFYNKYVEEIKSFYQQYTTQQQNGIKSIANRELVTITLQK